MSKNKDPGVARTERLRGVFLVVSVIGAALPLVVSGSVRASGADALLALICLVFGFWNSRKGRVMGVLTVGALACVVGATLWYAGAKSDVTTLAAGWGLFTGAALHDLTGTQIPRAGQDRVGWWAVIGIEVLVAIFMVALSK